MSNVVKNQALECTGFQEGGLPIKYLGLPLLATKLNTQDCYPLIASLCSRFDSWANKVLSRASRL